MLHSLHISERGIRCSEVRAYRSGGWDPVIRGSPSQITREKETEVQVGGTVQKPGTGYPRGLANARPAIVAIVAIAAIAAVVALAVWVAPLATSRVGEEGAITRAEVPWVTLYDDEGNAQLVRVREGGAEDAPPWVRLYDTKGNVHLVRAP